MNRTAPLTLIVCCMLLGCQSQGTPAQDARQPVATVALQPVVVAPPPSAAPPPAPSAVANTTPIDASADAPLAAGLPWPFSELPLASEDSLGMFGPRRGGFSNDDRYLGYEISTCDPCPSEFTFVSPRAPAISMSYFYAPQLDESIAEAQREKHDAAVDKRLLALGVTSFASSRALRGPFAYPDLTFASKTERSADDSVTLLFGAHLPGEEPVFPMRITIAPHPMRGITRNDKELKKLPPAEREKQLAQLMEAFTMSDPILAYANVTKDGQEIGVVAVATGTFWFEAAGVSRMRTSDFAQKVRDETKKRSTRRSP